MNVYERFARYVAIDTMPDAANPGGHPSTQKQYDLANVLVEEMLALGIADAFVNDKCIVYGHIPASPGCEGAPALGLIAHMDTSPDCSGSGVVPLLHPNYDGGDIKLPGGHVIEVATFPQLRQYQGQTLVTASGGTLLGADDKAGIAEIMAACQRMLKQDLPHGRLCIAFTPDEEIGVGVRDFDLEAFGAAFAYTLDGGPVEQVQYETFNGAAAKLTFTGVSVHPGTAKGILKNAARMAAEFDALLPADERPENTEGRQGFYHLTDIGGGVERAVAEYIIRDHDRARFEARKAAMQKAADEMRRRYGEGSVLLTMEDSYRNMGEVIEMHMHLVENAKAALRAMGLAAQVLPVRGGTDGSHLSYMGLPCPNLGVGGLYAHGPNECISIEAMERAVDLICGIAGIYARFTESAPG